MKKREMDVSLIPFIIGICNYGLKVLLVISVASMIGIATTSFVAVLGAAGLAVGLALQGSLANFAGGVLILIFKPFKVGDLIQSQGFSGTVSKITILNTEITTPDDNTAIIPNGIVANDKILNYTQKDIRRVDLEIGVAYGTDIDEAKKVIYQTLKKVEGVLENPTPFVSILSFGENGIILVVRPHCKSEDYWDVYFRSNEALYIAFKEADIKIPFPQREIQVIKS
ncbi:MAG: mechanosensitive ion channel family protein [Bacteroidia bacterium]